MEYKGAKTSANYRIQYQSQIGYQPDLGTSLIEVYHRQWSPGVFGGLVVEMKVSHKRSIKGFIFISMIHDHVDQTIEKISQDISQNEGQELAG